MMESNVFQKTVVARFLAIIILLPLMLSVLFAPAEAQSYRGERGILNPLEVSVYVPGGRSVQVESNSFNLSNGIELMASYKIARFINFAATFTHYAEVGTSSFNEEKSRLGIGGFVATPWSRLYPQVRGFNLVHYRFKIAAIYDLTGMQINSGSEDLTFGRFRESQIIVDFEFGLKAGDGMIFVGFSWLRAINGYSGGSFNVDSNDHLAFNIGISLL